MYIHVVVDLLLLCLYCMYCRVMTLAEWPVLPRSWKEWSTRIPMTAPPKVSALSVLCTCGSVQGMERERETDRQRERETDRETETETDTETERQRERQRERDREIKRQSDRERERELTCKGMHVHDVLGYKGAHIKDLCASLFESFQADYLLPTFRFQVLQ